MQRSPSRVSDPQPDHLDRRLLAGMHALRFCAHQSITNQSGQHRVLEAVRHQHETFGGAAWIAGQQLKRAPLLRIERHFARPIAINWRTAALNVRPCRFAHASTSCRASSSRRKPIIGVLPVAGRPIFFFLGLRVMVFRLA